MSCGRTEGLNSAWATPASTRWTLFCAALLLAAVGMWLFEGDVYDATGRAMLANDWLHRPFLITGTQLWPDGNYLLPAAAIAAGGDMFWSVRLAYALLGAATVPLVFELGQRLFDFRVGVWAAVAWLFCGYRVAFSLQGSSGEIPLLLCVLAALVVLTRDLEHPTWRTAVLVGLWCGVGSMFRFEAGYWALLFGALIFFPRGLQWPSGEVGKRFGLVVLLGTVAAIYPAFLVFRWWQVSGDPYFYFKYANVNQGQFYVTGSNPNWPNYIYYPFSASFWIASVFAVLTPAVALPALIGLGRALSNKRHVVLSLGCLILILLYSFASVRSRFPLEYRYALPVYAIGCVFLCSGWEWLAGRVKVLASARLQIILSAFSILLFYGGYSLAAYKNMGVVGRRLGMLSPIRPDQYSTLKLTKWYEENGENGRLLLSGCVNSPYILIGRPDLRDSGKITWFSTYIDDVHVHTIKSYTDAFITTLAKVQFVAFNRRCTGLGFTDGRVDEVLLPSLTESTAVAGNFRLEHVTEIDNLSVYRVAAPTGLGGVTP